MENNNKELQFYKCTEDFMMQIFDENCVPTGEYLPIYKGTKWVLDSKEVNLSNGELSLSSENLKITITKERLKRSFKEFEESENKTNCSVPRQSRKINVNLKNQTAKEILRDMLRDILKIFFIGSILVLILYFIMMIGEKYIYITWGYAHYGGLGGIIEKLTIGVIVLMNILLLLLVFFLILEGIIGFSLSLHMPLTSVEAEQVIEREIKHVSDYVEAVNKYVNQYTKNHLLYKFYEKLKIENTLVFDLWKFSVRSINQYIMLENNKKWKDDNFRLTYWKNFGKEHLLAELEEDEDKEIKEKIRKNSERRGFEAYKEGRKE